MSSFATARVLCRSRYANDGVVRWLIGTKCDIATRVVTEQEARVCDAWHFPVSGLCITVKLCSIAQAFATAHGMRYVEVSARTGENVTAMFEALNRVLVTKYECP